MLSAKCQPFWSGLNVLGSKFIPCSDFVFCHIKSSYVGITWRAFSSKKTWKVVEYLHQTFFYKDIFNDDILIMMWQMYVVWY